MSRYGQYPGTGPPFPIVTCQNVLKGLFGYAHKHYCVAHHHLPNMVRFFGNMRSTDEYYFFDKQSNPVNMQSRVNSFFEQLGSTHHCSRGWAKGSSLSICFLISRYEPWKNHTSMCCSQFFFTDLFCLSQMSKSLDTDLLCFTHTTYAVDKRKVENSNK